MALWLSSEKGRKSVVRDDAFVGFGECARLLACWEKGIRVYTRFGTCEDTISCLCMDHRG